MNISKRLSILTFALATFAAAPSEAATGDIVEIRAVDDTANLMVFGSARNAGNPYLCSADHPLSAGDKLYIRVRMLVRNYDAVRRGIEGPKVWTFKNGALGGSLLNRPKLGLYMGQDRAPAYAELSDFGPQPWQQSGTLVTDDLGNADTGCRYYTDFYFCYTVQAGDLSLPVRLLNASGTGPADDSDTDAAYYLLNCQTDSQYFVLSDSDGNVANFFYGADVLPAGVDWPVGDATTAGPVRNYDLASEGAFVKTIDFDSGDPSLTGYWREVYEGLGPDTIPSLIVVGGENTAATVVYLWSSDESKVELAASGDNTIVTTTDGRHLLRVPVPAGASSVTFTMRGATGAAENDEAEIFMSPVANAVYRPTGELAGVTVSRLVRVGPPREPTVRIFINAQDKVTDTKVAVPEYEVCENQLILTVAPTCPEDITVRIKAAVNTDDTLSTLADIFDQNILRIASATFGGSPLDQRVSEVTIPAGTSTLPLNLYLLGATSKTHTQGVTFSLEKVSGPTSAQVPTDSNCTLYIRRTSKPAIIASTPEFTVGETLGTIEIGSGTEREFALEIEDTYKNRYDTATGYTFTWKIEGEEIEPADGVVMDEDDGLFKASATFYTVTSGKELTLQVTAPNGTKSDVVKYWLVVNDGKYTTIARTDGRLVFCEGEETRIKLGLTQAYSGTGYIFLSADDQTQLDVIDSPLKTEGAQITRGTTEVATERVVRFLDGGRDLSLKAVLCSQNDLSRPVTTFGSGTIEFTVTNRPPQVMSVTAAGQYRSADQNGQALPDAISRGVVKTFSLVVDDVDADLNATGADAMQARWIIDGTTHEVTHDESATFSVQHTFANEKDNALVQVYVKDKDMTAYPSVPNFSFTAKIKDTPRVEIAPSASMFVEKDKNVSTITVSLTEAASAPITVRFTVSQTSAADGGYLKLRLQEGSVAAATDEAGNEIPGAYDLTFGAGVQQKILIVSDMDGTIETLAGLDLNAYVTTETLNADGVKWSEFYTRAEPQIIQVENAAPEILRPSDAEAAYTNMNASANTPYAINYACSDVTADLAAGITVEISVDGVLATTEKVTSATMQTYSVEFDGEGAHVVEIVFTDKDQQSARRTLYYFVKPSKRLELRAHGPANGVAGGHSERYSDAPGLGAGAVFAGSAGPQKVERFVHTYSFGETEKSVKAYARGYKADGSYDNGSLAQSKGIDSDGNWSKGTTIAPDAFYNYSKQNRWGLLGYDSFVYAWVCNNAASSGGESSGGQTETLKLNITDQGETVLSLPDSANQGNNSNSGTTTSYPMQYWEAVFSREFLPTDNAGDINQDGIPDVVVKKFGFGVIDPQTLQISGDDLEDLSAYNEDEDYLPAGDNSIYGSLIPGLKDDWSSPFTTDLEIRGYGKGLNDALEQLGLNVTPIRVYEDPTTCPTSTLSRVEWLAWSEYKAAHPGATEADWSPERPTDPTVEDTDKDGFSDGYEYYYWYLAHVGYIDAYGNHKYLTGRRYDKKNPGVGTLITSETIAGIMDPRVKYTGSDAATRDSDNDGLPDLLEYELGTNPFDFDTDGDGLPDGWEVMIAGLDPLMAQSYADGLSDTERNTDGDAMAISSYKLEQTELPVPVNYEHAKRWTFAVIDADGDTDGVQWYAVTADPTSKLEVLTTVAGGYRVTAVVDGATATFFAETEPTVATEGSVSRLAAATKVRTLVTWKPDGATEEKALGYPYTLPIGTRVVVTPLAEEVKSYKIASAIDAKDANACWIYGKGAARTQLGEVAETAAEYGCLALARQRAVTAGAEVAALPSDERDVAFLHFLCYQEFGFDPRTAWNPTNPLHKRWGKVTNGESEEGIYVVDRGGYTGTPARTRAYANYDEFLVSSFFVNNTPDGETLSYETYVTAKDAPNLARFWGALTTNPQGPNDAEKTSTDHYYGRSSTNGADTDGDGVPDGWELYVMAGPKKKGAYVFAPPYAGFTPANAAEAMEKSWFSPFVDAAKSNDTSNQIYLGGQEMSDGLNEFQEFEGTDTMLYYAKYSTTVVHDGEWKWLNKFFPTDPWSPDTDGDGVKDAEERDAFAYTTATYDDATHGELRVIPGGGLNPNSVDTDCDGLPDGWEKQFAGKTVYAKDGVTDETKGYVDGMDGTVEDAYTKPGDVNRDYDNDGLENWQEYLTGTMRCWRYDDPISPLTYLSSDFYYTVDPATSNIVFDADAAARKFHAAGLLDSDDVNEFWYKTLVDASSAIYNPHLVTDMGSGAQYFSRVTNVWDAAYLDLTLSKNKATGAYYWFYDRIGEHKLKDLWGEAWKALAAEDAGAAGVGSVAPTKYASCSPIEADTDKDGMDDYYEVFHGMNPLLGTSGIDRDSGAYDVIFDSLYADNKVVPEAWGTGNSASSFKNYWQRKVALPSWTGKKPRGNEFDFEVFPWLNGLAGADPDGDGLNNQEEAILPLVNTLAHHTDPTPLWMTDTSYSNSLVRMNYRLPYRASAIPLTDDGFTYENKKYLFGDFDGFVKDAKTGETVFGPFNPDAWKLVGTRNSLGWIASFEQNEGFDSDHDGINDLDELKGKFRSKSDPLDVDSPQRRQAMYFQGPNRPSILQTLPFTKEYHPMAYRAGRYPDDMAFLQYTVECWVKAESLADATVIERAVLVGLSSPDDQEYVRCNFRLGLKGGKWYTGFDPNNTTAESVSVLSTTAATSDWTHLAATYDGTTLTLYVNGRASSAVRCGLQPTYGASDIATIGPGGAFNGGRSYAYHAIVLGASVKTYADGHYGRALDVTLGSGWNAYKDFFTGYIDEVRVWDGARTATEIADAKMTRFTSEDAKANREAFFAEWSKGGENDLYRGRYAKDGSGNPYPLPAELRFHWAFDSLFGAASEEAVAKAPAGFNYLGENADGDGGRALRSRPEGYGIAWWQSVLSGYTGTVYNDPAWICWVPNTVSHLPRYDGTTLDSRYWSEDFEGQKGGIYKFARTAEPASVWTQCLRGDVKIGDDQYFAAGSRHHLVAAMDAASGSNLSTLFEFTGRHLNQTGDDLLALGGAYAKHVDDLWDSQGASSNWEIAGTDGDGDGLPDWWEKLAEDRYRDDAHTGTGDIGWGTMVRWPDQNGTLMTAGEAYLRDLARGYHGDENDDPVTDDADSFRQRYDLNGNGLPDWWEELYGLQNESGLDDHDNDGLPNYVEYLLSEVFSKLGKTFDPTRADSVEPGVPDYFFQVGDLYVGEIFTDHDLVDDVWEDLYSDGYASRSVYDPFADSDGDGWSNRSEARYAKQCMPTVADGQSHYSGADGLVADYPIPTIALSVNYAGQRKDAVEKAPLVIQMHTNTNMNRGADAVYSIGAVSPSDSSSSSSSSSEASDTSYRVLGKWSDRHAIGTLTPGYINKNSLELQYCYDPSGENYSWTIGGQTNYANSVLKRGTLAEYEADRIKYGSSNVALITRDTGYMTLVNLEVRTDADNKTATWVRTNRPNTPLGTIDLVTGAFDIDLGSLKGQYVVNATNDSDYISLEDQSFRIAYTANEAVGIPRKLYLGQADTGHVREGKNTIIAFADLDGDGAYTAGEPYGCVTGVDVSWKGTSAELMLTDTTPVFARVDPIKGLDDRTVLYGTESGNYTNFVSASQPSGGVYDRIRVVRHMVIGSQGNAAVQDIGAGVNRVLFDLQVSADVNPWITEANFLATGALDVDWETLYDDIVSRIDSEGKIPSSANASIKYAIGDVQGVVYRIVFGNESVDPVGASSNMSKVMPVRWFDSKRLLPVPVSSGSGNGVVKLGQPTFKWRMPNNSNGYTAFKVMIKATDGSFSWTSDYLRMPAADADGVYMWAAPVFVGDRPAGATGVFANNAAYTWSISASNAKFKNDSFVTGGTFRMGVQTNGYDIGGIATSVRYYGPAIVTNDANALIRVRAYTSPDFTGAPVSGGFVDKSVTDGGVNCRILGLPKGDYYLQAFVDSNGNGVWDKWESMGYFCQRDGSTADYLNPVAVTVGGSVGASEVVTIYLEDADTDGDNLPDAWEYATATSTQRANGTFLAAKGVDRLTLSGAGEVAIDSMLTSNLLYEINRANVPTAGLASGIRDAFLSSASFAALAMGVSPNLTVDPLTGELCQNPTVEDGTLVISGLAFDAATGAVELTVAGAVTQPNPVASGVYRVKLGSTVTVKVLHTATLAGEWQTVATEAVMVSGDSLKSGVICVPMADVQATGGFYKVEIEQ